MDAEGRRKAKELIAGALTQPTGERDRYLESHCDDQALREEVEALLRVTDDIGALDALLSEPVADEPPQLEPGTRVGPYLILESLGIGGMGAVFLGSDTRLRRKVALKCLTSHGTLPELRAKILHEARAAARISHPNVAVVHDVIEHAGRAFLVMEYVEGESLASRLRHERLSTDQAIAFGRQLAAALVAAHARDVIHRDLKPANVQVTPDGTVKVLDFGVAQAEHALSSVSHATTTIAPGRWMGQPGTPAYMAPEQLLGQAADERSDIYSLGVVLYEMLVGHRPYAPTDRVALLAALVEEAPALHAVDPRIPISVSNAVGRAIARDPRLRFQSAAELAAALAALDGSKPARRRSRRPAALIAAVAVVAAASVGVIVRRAVLAPPARAPIVAVMPFDGGDTGSATLTAGLGEVLSANLTTLPGVVVVPRASLAAYRPSTGLSKAAKDFGFDYAITGAVQWTGGRPSVVLKVIEASRGAIVASHAFAASGPATFPLLQGAGDWVIAEVEKLAGSSTDRRAAVATANMQAFEDYSQGRQFLDRRDVAANVERAITALERAAARDPKFALAHAALGDAYWMRYQASRDPKYAQQAKDATLEALRLDPGQPLVRYSLALVYQGTGRKDAALEELHAALAVQPSSDTIHREVCRIYSDLGRHDEAIAECLAAIALRPGFWGNYRALGLTYYFAGRFPDAIATLTRLVELQPDSQPGFLLLGAAYDMTGDSERALANYERANAISPSAAAWANIGEIRARRGHFPDAVTAFNESIKLQPKEPETYRSLGNVLARSGDQAAAAAAYQKAVATCDERLDVEKGDAIILSEKAVNLAKLERFAAADRAIADARAHLASAPVLYNAAIVEALERRVDAALESLRLAVEKGSSRAAAREDDDLAALRSLPEFERIVSAR